MSVRNRVATAQYLLPDALRLHVTAYRRRPHWERAGVIFVHVPKVAGVSISASLYGRPLGHIPATVIRRACPDLYEKLPVISVVRNPWDRLVSAYHFAVAGGTRHAGIKRKGQYQSDAFRSFDSFVEEWLAAQPLDRIDPVFRPQYLYVCDQDKRPIVNFLGKLEALDELRIYLMDILGTWFPLPRLNVREMGDSYRSYYKRTGLRNAVGDLYRTDADLFEYSW